MPENVIPFVPHEQSSSSDLGGASPYAINVSIDRAGVVRRRPGITTYSPAPSTVVDANGIAGLFSTVEGSLLAVSDHPSQRSIYRVAAGVAVQDTNAIDGAGRPVFAETEAIVLCTAGGLVKRITKPGLTTVEQLANAPSDCSHIIANSSRLVANTAGSGIMYYSSQAAGSSYAGHEVWSVGGGGGFFSAEGRPDPVVAIGETTARVLAWGTQSVQAFSPDADLNFAPVVTYERGTTSPYSIVKADEVFYWLDHKRRFVGGSGEPQVISQDIQGELDDMSAVSDCFGYWVKLGYLDAIVWTFPTDGRSYCYQMGGGWSRWHGWNAQTNNHALFSVLSQTSITGSGAQVVGTVAGKIGQLSHSATTDLGTKVTATVRTGFLNRGTDRRKKCDAAYFTIRRGTTDVAPVATVRWRDDGGSWGQPRTVGFGTTSSRDFVVRLRSLGVYRRRDWEFTFSDDSTELELAAAVEHYTELAN
jgi:hypothetical protein